MQADWTVEGGIRIPLKAGEISLVRNTERLRECPPQKARKSEFRGIGE